MDFIEPLPTSSDCDAILVIVDCLTKQGIFIPTTIHCTSEDLAILFILHVFSKHGVPAHVTSDRGPEFISRFFCSLGKALDITLHFTSGYQPEWTNQTLEQYLRIYCDYQQDNWRMLLPLAESPTTILLVLPPVFLRSLQTKDIICTSPSIPNVISPHLELKTLSLILMNSTKNLNPSSPQLKTVIKVPPIPVACRLQTLLLVSKHSSKRSFSAPPAHPRNYQKSSHDLL